MPGGFSYLGNFRVEEDSGEVVSQSIGSSALLSTCCDDTSLEVSSTTGKLQVKVRGDAMTGGVPRDHMSKYAGTWIRGALAVSASTAGIFQLTNTTGESLIITRVLIHISAACTVDSSFIDIGMGDSASTNYDNLIDGLSVNAVGAFDNITDKGTNGKSRQLWLKNTYINASTFNSSGAVSPTNLVGSYAIHVIDISN